MKPSFTRCSLLLIATLLVSLTISADTLILRDGRRIEGQLVSVQNGLIEFVEARAFNGGRTVRFDRNELVGIEFDRNDRNTSRFPSQSQQQSQSQTGRPSGLRERQIMVAANVPFVDTNIDLQTGQQIYFEASGEVNWGPGRRDGPNGEQNSPMNANRPMPNRPAAGLIGRVGGNSTDYFYIGADRGAVRIRSSGRLFLSVNDDVLQDNSGAFRVIVYY